MANRKSRKQIEYFRKNGNPFVWKLELLNAEYITTPYSRNDRPNSDMVTYYINNKWSIYQFEEDALNLIFSQFNNTQDRQHVFSRLLALNSIYSTELDTKKMIILADVLINHTKGLTLSNYIPDIVDEIRTDFKTTYNYDPYSFISKYFSHINEDAYPIYDSYVKTMLLWYKFKFKYFDFEISDLENYDKFKAIIENFILVFELNCSLRTADKFLWTAGKEFFPKFVYEDLIKKYKSQ